MVIGPDFAYGHIPKTGGDAVHQYFGLIAEPGWVVDDVSRREKHLGFAGRGAAGKRHLILSVRRLPGWVLSLLHELTLHQYEWPRFGWSCAADVLRPESGLLRPWADAWLADMAGGLAVTHWLRMEHLADDFIAVASEVVRPLTEAERAAVRSAATKPPRAYDRDPARFWTADQIAELYRLNPRWAEVERRLYA